MQPTGLEGTAGCGEKAAASRVPFLAPSAPTRGPRVPFLAPSAPTRGSRVPFLAPSVSTRGSRVPFLAPSAPTETPCFLAVNRVDPVRRKGTVS